MIVNSKHYHHLILYTGISIGMSLQSYTVNESDDEILVCAVVVEGESERTVNFTMWTTDNSATSIDSRDFTAISDGFQFNNINLTTVCVNIIVNDDNRVEYPENFTVGISSKDSDVDYMIQESTVTIIDDDKASIGFEKSVYKEMEGQTFEVCVMARSSILERSVSVNVNTMDFTTQGLTHSHINTFLQILQRLSFNFAH